MTTQKSRKLQRQEARAYLTRVAVLAGNAPGTGDALLSRTKQSFRDACDINNIVDQHRKTGLITHVNDKTPLYGDFSEANDLHTAMERVSAAEASFDALPSAVRAAAENNPVRFLEMLDDEDQAKLLAKAGLVFDPEAPPAAAPPSPHEPSDPETAPPKAEGRPAPASS